MSHACRLSPRGFFIVLALAASVYVSAVGPDTVAPEVHFQHEIAYVSGGAGSDERDVMRAMARRFNARLNAVSASIGEALSDVDVFVADDRGKLRLRARMEGPLSYMRLPRGYHRIVVAHRGVMQAVNVSVSARLVDAAVRLRTEPGSDGWLLCQRGCPCAGARPTVR